jgi:hypothetical protein
MWHQFIDGDRRRTFPVINSLTVTDCIHFPVINRLMATDCGHFSIINQLMAGKWMQTLTEWPLMAENDFKTYPEIIRCLGGTSDIFVSLREENKEK